jgi:excisionase family DNA binding protein
MLHESNLPGHGDQAIDLTFFDRYLDSIASRLERKLEKWIPANANTKRLFTVPEAAEYIGRSENAVKILIHRGKLPVTRIDSKSQIDKGALDKLIEECTYYESDHQS